MNRIVIMGNAGSGKSYLAQRLAAARRRPITLIDELYRSTGGGGQERSPEEVYAEIEAIKQGEEWVVEGVSGELAQRFLDRADYLIWLDLPWITCRAGLETLRQKAPPKSGDTFAGRLTWAQHYWTRTDASSHAGHLAIFEKFPGAKDRIVFHGCAEALYED